MHKPSAVAIHEAGHAVMAFMLRVDVAQVVLTGVYKGYCEYKIRGKTCPFIRVMIASAGHRAEVLWAGRDIKKLPASDWNWIVNKTWFSMFAANQIGYAAATALKQNKDMVMAVARELDEKRRLSAAGFLRIVRPFVASMGDRRMVIPLRLRPRDRVRGSK